MMGWGNAADWLLISYAAVVYHYRYCFEALQKNKISRKQEKDDDLEETDIWGGAREDDDKQPPQQGSQNEICDQARDALQGA